MQKESKIYVAGHKGMVGSAIYSVLKASGYTNLIGRSSAELDLRDSVAVEAFFECHRPEYVILAAAKVGGIAANNTFRADFISDNLQIQQNVISQSHRYGVKKMLFLGSTCIYPRNAVQPIVESELLTGELEYTNEPYAIAKIAGLKLCESLNIQYGTNFIAVMPTNLYGESDNFDLETSHVLPAIVRKLHLASLLERGDWQAIRADITRRPINNITFESSEEDILFALEGYGILSTEEGIEVRLWGSGTALREFLWSRDMAEASVYIMERVDFKELIPKTGDIKNCHINIGSGIEHSISEVAQIAKNVVGFNGNITFDHTKPDGTPRKLTDVTKLHRLGWHHSVELESGLEMLYRWYSSDI